MKTRICSIGFATISVMLLTGADWLQFRGNDVSSVATDQSPPAQLSDADNLDWKIELTGRGLSGPIVIGDRVVVTCSSGFRQDRLHVMCFDAGTGKEVWHRQFWATGRTMCHPKMCVATPTPASDGERIFAFFSCNDLACLDLEGNLLWYRGLTHDFPNASNSLGMASSPIVIGDTLVVQVESDAESFSTGLELDTGLARWKIPRTRRANWTSPVVLHDTAGGEPLAVLQSSAGLSAVDPVTGNEVWSFNDGASTIPSSVVSNGTVYVPSHGLAALRSVAGKKTPETLWQDNRLGPGTASPLVHRERVYVVNNAGVLVCAAAESGESIWKLRLKGRFSGTPVAAGDHLYFFNEEGLAQVVKIADKAGEVVDELALGETILCSPAIANGALYVRSDGHLWKFSK